MSEKTYVCHQCGANFLKSNSLRSHRSRRCGQKIVIVNHRSFLLTQKCEGGHTEYVWVRSDEVQWQLQRYPSDYKTLDDGKLILYLVYFDRDR